MSDADDDQWALVAATAYGLGGDHAEPANPDDQSALLGALVERFEAPADRYEVGPTLGSGGWKHICSAYDRHGCREIAFARPRDPGSPEVIEAFLREAHLIAFLQHPNIIAIHNMGVFEGQPFFTMGKQLGGDLRCVLGGHSKDPPEGEHALNIFRQVCQAVAYAHSVDIVHLDLKPENIQTGSHGEVYVCDWGLGAYIGKHQEDEKMREFADLCGDNGDFTRLSGTPGYVAPEYLSRHQQAAPAADIYSLGIILGEISALFDRPKGRRLSAISKKASADDPGERYGSVEGLLADLTRFDKNLPSTVEPGGGTARLGLFLKRHQTAVTCALGTCAIGSVFTIAMLQRHHTIERERDQALLAEAQATKSRQLAHAETKSIREGRLDDAVTHTRFLLEAIVADPKSCYVTVQKSISQLQIALDVAGDELGDAQQERAWAQLGYTLLLAQRFTEAADAYAKTDRDDHLRQIAEEFQSLEGNGVPIPEADLIRLLRSFPKRLRFQQQLVIYDRQIRGDWDSKIAITLALLESMNPDWTADQCERSGADRSLTLRGQGLTSLEYSQTSKISALHGLNIKILRFEGTGFLEYRQLKGAGFVTLDVSGEKNPMSLSDLPEVFSRFRNKVEKGGLKIRE